MHRAGPAGNRTAGRCGVTSPTKALKLSPSKDFLRPGLLLKNIPRRSVNLDEAPPAEVSCNKLLMGSPNHRARPPSSFTAGPFVPLLRRRERGASCRAARSLPYCSYFSYAFCLVTTVSKPQLFTLSSNESFHDLYNSTFIQSSRVPCIQDVL